MIIVNEKWETIKEFPNYMISSESRVLNKTTLKMVSVHLHKHGHRVVRLWKNGKTRLMKIYRLKAMAFIANPFNKREVNHLDGNRLNEDLENLEWTTPSENMKHAFKYGFSGGFFKNGFDHKFCKLKPDDVELIRRLRKDKLLSIYKLSKVFNVTHHTISRVANGRMGNHV